MSRFVIDEDMSRSLARELAKSGYDVQDVRDVGLRGKSDEEVYQFALDQKATLITGDLGFGNILKFPPGSHYGIVVAHFPNELSTQQVNQDLLSRLQTLSENDLMGKLVIIEPGKTRIRS